MKLRYFSSKGSNFDTTTASRTSKRRGKPRENFTIDATGLISRDIGFGKSIDENNDDNNDPSLPVVEKEIETPLGEDLNNYIRLRGPLTVHEYMSQCLNHGYYGYYQTKTQKIGTDGDFVTAPEMSQLFGEMIAIWCVSVWKEMGCPKQLNIVEMGPGKGTLMKDILDSCKPFKKFCDSINIHLVELSPAMKQLQQEKLEIKSIKPDNIEHKDEADGKNKINANDYIVTKQDIPVKWHNFLNQVPAGPSLYIGQEFLDAFPVHQFVLTSDGWRERMIDIDDSKYSPYHFRIVMAPSPTPASKVLLENVNVEQFLEKKPKSMKDYNNNNEEEEEEEDIGVEVNPLAIAACEDIAKRVANYGGAALFIDYGEVHPLNDSLRAFNNHEQVNILSLPGKCDITCDIDFATLSHRAKEQGASVAPIIGQGEFLMRMGLVARLEALIQKDSTTDEQAEKLVASAKRLVDDNDMGERFKVMCIKSKDLHVEGFP